MYSEKSMTMTRGYLTGQVLQKTTLQSETQWGATSTLAIIIYIFSQA